MARFFIDRPVFAMVIAIVIVILGAVAIPNLPVATYPEVVPPVVQIIANYRGGNSQDLEKTVAQPIEQQLVGLDGMLYFFSRSSNDGVLTIDVTFELGTDIDLATVKTQNKVNLALPSLPPEVQREGVTVKKVSSAFLLAIGCYADRRPLRLAVPQQLRHDQPGRQDRQHSRRRRCASGSRAGLRHARLDQSGQDGEAGLDRDRCQPRDPGAEPAEPGGRHRSAARRRPARTSSIR